MLCCYARIRKKLNQPKEIVEAEEEKSHKIPFSAVKETEYISFGGSSIVSKAIYNGKEVAAKDISYVSFADVFPEANMLKKLNAFKTNYFIHYFGYTLCLRWRTTRFMVIVAELMSSTLTEYLKAHTQSLSVKLDIMSQISHGVAILHQHHIIHRDLKAMNIFVNTDKASHQITDVKIGDFGGAIQLNSDEEIYFADNSHRTTKRWAAPEGSRLEFSKAYDIYSLGILFWEIMTDCEKLPFANIETQEVRRRNNQKDVHNPLPASTPTTVAMLITRCNNFFPALRPTITQVVEQVDQLIVADIVEGLIAHVAEEKVEIKPGM